MAPDHTDYMTDATGTATHYARLVEEVIPRLVAELNDAMGLPLKADFRDPASFNVSFGYIGDLTNRGQDTRSWMVFLPHPGRVGKNEDSLGGFATGDIDGARRLVAELVAATRVVNTVKRLGLVR